MGPQRHLSPRQHHGISQGTSCVLRTWLLRRRSCHQPILQVDKAGEVHFCSHREGAERFETRALTTERLVRTTRTLLQTVQAGGTLRTFGLKHSFNRWENRVKEVAP